MTESTFNEDFAWYEWSFVPPGDVSSVSSEHSVGTNEQDRLDILELPNAGGQDVDGIHPNVAANYSDKPRRDAVSADQTSRHQIRIFDTTLRDGEQSPGASLTPQEKAHIARQLDKLGVDVIEAGFPAASPGDALSVELVAEAVQHAQVAALARCTKGDIDAAATALRNVKRPILHVFTATSDIHLRHKLKLTRTEVVARVTESVAYARSLVPEVEFSAEDATRSDWDYLAMVCAAAIRAGANTINLPDTVGYVMPDEYAAMFRYVRDRIGGEADGVIWSAHCHDDLGFATANTIAAIQAGVRQIEVTINGLGERAGNAALEEVVMALKTRGESLGLPETVVDTRELVPTSHMVSRLTGLAVQPNKAIVGANAFAHEAGIHQDGVIKERTTYEIMHPSDVGWGDTKLVLGKHSGRHGMSHRLEALGYELAPAQIDEVYRAFIVLADRHKVVDDAMLRSLVAGKPPLRGKDFGGDPSTYTGDVLP